MNATQQTQYAKAIARAADRGVQVAGKGTAKNGATVYAVTSGSDANRWHLVTVNGSQLECDCTAAQHGRYCCHRAIVSARIERERAEAEAVAEAERIARDHWELVNMGGACLGVYAGW